MMEMAKRKWSRTAGGTLVSHGAPWDLEVWRVEGKGYQAWYAPSGSMEYRNLPGLGIVRLQRDAKKAAEEWAESHAPLAPILDILRTTTRQFYWCYDVERLLRRRFGLEFAKPDRSAIVVRNCMCNTCMSRIREYEASKGLPRWERFTLLYPETTPNYLNKEQARIELAQAEMRMREFLALPLNGWDYFVKQITPYIFVSTAPW